MISVRNRLVSPLFVVAASCFAGCNPAPKPMIVACTMEKDQIDVVRLDLRQGQATLLSVSPSLTGSVSSTPTEYEALFQPGPDGAARLLIKINRYTLRATREPGPYTGDTAAAAGPRSTGTCERYKGKPL